MTAPARTSGRSPAARHIHATSTAADLQTRLLAAHADGDTAALVRLYTQAAGISGSRSEAAFFLTQAYVHALERGLPETAALRARLRSMGRED